MTPVQHKIKFVLFVIMLFQVAIVKYCIFAGSSLNVANVPPTRERILLNIDIRERRNSTEFMVLAICSLTKQYLQLQVSLFRPG